MKKQRQKRSQDKEYWKALNDLLDVIFAESDRLDWSLRRLANEAHLDYMTVWRMDVRYTRFPEFRSVWRLARAVRMELTAQTIKDARVRGAK